MTIGDPGLGATPDSYTAGELIARADLDSASRAVRGATVRTPTLASAELTEIAGTQPHRGRVGGAPQRGL